MSWIFFLMIAFAVFSTALFVVHSLAPFQNMAPQRNRYAKGVLYTVFLLPLVLAAIVCSPLVHNISKINLTIFCVLQSALLLLAAESSFHISRNYYIRRISLGIAFSLGTIYSTILLIIYTVPLGQNKSCIPP